MGCCKNSNITDGGNVSSSSLFGRIIFFVIGLIIITLLLPLIWSILIYFLFNASIRNKDTNILPMIKIIWNIILKQGDSDDEYDDSDEDDNSDDYELLDYEKIE